MNRLSCSLKSQTFGPTKAPNHAGTGTAGLQILHFGILGGRSRKRPGMGLGTLFLGIEIMSDEVTSPYCYYYHCYYYHYYYHYSYSYAYSYSSTPSSLPPQVLNW